MTEVTAALAAEGWECQITPLEGGRVRCEGCSEEFDAASLVVDSFSRVEGASDPDDMAAVIAVTCGCGSKGALVLAYGPEASGADSDVLLALPDPPAPREPGLS